MIFSTILILILAIEQIKSTDLTAIDEAFNDSNLGDPDHMFPTTMDALRKKKDKSVLY